MTASFRAMISSDGGALGVHGEDGVALPHAAHARNFLCQHTEPGGGDVVHFSLWVGHLDTGTGGVCGVMFTRAAGVELEGGDVVVLEAGAVVGVGVVLACLAAVHHVIV